MKQTEILSLDNLVTRLPAVIQNVVDRRIQFVIVDVPPYYVQLAVEDDWILGEAVSNGYLEPWQLLNERHGLRLEELGWQRPGVMDRDGDDHLNYFREWESDTSPDEIAIDLIATLVSVYVRGEGDLVQLCTEDAPESDG